MDLGQLCLWKKNLHFNSVSVSYLGLTVLTTYCPEDCCLIIERREKNFVMELFSKFEKQN